MKSSHFSYGFLLSFLLCLFGLQYWQQPAYSWQIYAALGVVVLLGAFKWRVLSAVSLGCIVSFLMASSAVHVTTPIDIEAQANGQSATIHGWIVVAPDVRPTVTKLVIGVDQVIDGSGSRLAQGRVLVNDNNAWPLLLYGDEVSVKAKLRRPEIIDDFDYPQYLELQGIRAVMTNARVAIANEGRPQPSSARTYWIFGFLATLRTWMEGRIGVILPEPHASLMAGLLTGSRRGLPAYLSDAFRISGLTHIVAVSGSNVTIILAVLGSALFWIPVKQRFWVLVTGALGFMFFVGAGAPVVRATVMGILGLIALQTNRIAMPRLTILWTAFIMLLWNPMMLWYDASFQLSFLAVLGLMEFSPWLKKVFWFVPETLAIRESLVATVAAQIATLPVSILLFKQFSLIAPLTNILVAPLIPLSMLLGAVSVVASMLWMPLGLVFGYCGWALLQMIMIIVRVGAAVPYAAIMF